MAKALRYEKADELGNPIKRLKTPNPVTAVHPRKPCQVKKPCIDTSVDIPTDIFVVSSDDDDNYETTTESSMSLESGLTDTDWPGEYDSLYRLV